MARKRKRTLRRQTQREAGRRQAEPRLPSDLQTKFSNVGLELARDKLRRREWRAAYEFADGARSTEPVLAVAVMAEASARQARRSSLQGDFAAAELWAKRALELRPGWPAYQERLRLIRAAKEDVLRVIETPLFPDTIGPSRGAWWEHDLLHRVRGWDGAGATVPAPLILDETKRGELEDIYAVGVYQPWHVAGPAPMFTRYIRELKAGGQTVELAAVLLRQGLTLEVDWAEEVDVIVPVPTALRSYDERGFELTERLGEQLAQRLCVPFVDAFEKDPEAEATRRLGGYRDRARLVAPSLRLKKAHAALIEDAEAVLVVDDVVTYGSTFEACAVRLRAAYPALRVYGAALAHTETPERRARAEREREA